MRRKLLLVYLALSFALLGGSTVAMADIDYDGYENSGQFIGVVESENDNDLSAVISYLASQGFENLDLVFYAKVESSETTTLVGENYLHLTYEVFKEDDPGESIAGTWTTDKDPNNPPEGPPISFYSVKAGDNYAIYYVNPADDSGTWTTEKLDGKGISHFAAWIWNREIPENNPVPEPATLLLMGLGLIGIAKLQRNRK